MTTEQRERAWRELVGAGWSLTEVGQNVWAVGDANDVREFDTRDQAIDYALQLAREEK